MVPFYLKDIQSSVHFSFLMKYLPKAFIFFEQAINNLGYAFSFFSFTLFDKIHQTHALKIILIFQFMIRNYFLMM